MNKVFTTIILFFCAFAINAQSIKVVNTEPNSNGLIGETLETIISIQNVSNETIYILTERLTNQIGSTQSSYFCLDENCSKQEENKIDQAIKLEPGQIFSGFKSVLEAGLTEQYSTVTYLFFNRDNQEDAITFDINYSIEEETSQTFLYLSDEIQLKDVYPNPVVDNAIIKYQILNEEVEAKIVIHNVLGSIIGEYQLPPMDTELKISTTEFNPGIYFYTLYWEGVGRSTGKMIVNK